MLISRCLAFIILGLAPALAGDLRMGRASVEITPPPAMAMGGYFKIRLNTGKHDPLYAKAIVLEQDNVKVAMVFCDLLNLPRSFVDDARTLIQATTGVPSDHVMISATHSHTGPEMNHVFLDRLEGAPAQVAQEYRAELPRQIAEAVKEAEADLQPVEVWAGTGRETSLPFNRRYLMKDGSIAWNPGKLNPQIVRPAGPTDPAIPIVYFTTPSASPLATFVNYAMHADTTGGTEYSADYPGALARALATVKGSEMLTLFAIGAAGNINHLDVGRADRQQGPRESARIGAILAGDVSREYPRLTKIEGPLRFRRAIIALPVQQLQPGEVEKSRELVDRAVHQGPEGIPFLQLVQAVKAQCSNCYGFLMLVEFTKMNGAGNDFVLLDGRARKLKLERGQIARICDRHAGVGADGLIVLLPCALRPRGLGLGFLQQRRQQRGNVRQRGALFCPLCAAADRREKRHHL